MYPDPEIVWHYTTAAAAAKIIRDGELKLPDYGVALIWFTCSPDWEPTANKTFGVEIDGTVGDYDADADEMAERGGGLVRFGIRSETLIHWDLLVRERDEKFITVRKALAEAEFAAQRGSVPTDWWASAEPIKTEAVVVIEKYDPIAKRWVKALFPM